MKKHVAAFWANARQRAIPGTDLRFAQRVAECEQRLIEQGMSEEHARVFMEYARSLFQEEYTANLVRTVVSVFKKRAR